MGEMKTSVLKEKLSRFTSVSDGVKFIQDQKGQNIAESFKEFWDNYIFEHNISLKQSKIFELAGLASSTGNDVLNGKNIPKRDTCLALCFAIGMNLEDTNRALRSAKCPELKEKNGRGQDYALMIYFEQHSVGVGDIHNVTELNLALEEAGVEPLVVSR